MKIKYVQLESQAFLTDLDFVMMSAAERGVYCTLLLHLYCNGGRCELDTIALARLCNYRNFEKIWRRLGKKFQTRKGVIRHKRVSRELRRAKRYAQAKRRAGLASAAKRNTAPTALEQRVSSGATKKRKGKENEKGSKQLTNTYEQAPSSSSSIRPITGMTESRRRPPESKVKGVESIGKIIERLGIPRESAGKALGTVECTGPDPEKAAGKRSQGLHFHEALTNIIRPRSRSDRTCFRNVTNWMTRRFAEGRFDNETFKTVLGFADEAKTARNPAAAFMALLKKELRYPNG